MNKFSKYSRVGILIRPYMNYVMAVKMEEMRDADLHPRASKQRVGRRRLFHLGRAAERGGSTREIAAL